MINNHYNKHLFSQEIEILRSCKSDLSSNKYENDILLPKYKELVESYEKLLKLTQKAFKISDTQGSNLKRREQKIKSLLDNSNQGFLTFGENLLVDEEYSAECVCIFGKKIKKEKITLLLSTSPDEQQKYNNVFGAVFQEKKEEKLRQLPINISINDRLINVKYKLINWLDNEYNILVILTDVTGKIKSEAQVKYLSEHDSLTKLYNRFYVEKIIPQIMSPSSMPLSIVLTDMNALKLTNDMFGHQKGDELIIGAAKILEKCSRKTDIVARWGGDEFLIILPHTDKLECQEIINAIYKACQESDHGIVDISLSIGTVTIQSLNVNINELFAIAENRMYKDKLLQNKAVRKNIISKMETVLQEKAIVPPGHIKRMKNLAKKFAKVLDFEKDSLEVKHFMLLASLHDVGKLALPEDILKKQGSLNPEEWEIIKNYSGIGYRMAMSIGEQSVAEAILALRERWDGTGYPNGLKGEQIPYIARAFTILEAFDTMTSNRVYQRSISENEALWEIRRQKGLQFDPMLTDLFLDNIGLIL